MVFWFLVHSARDPDVTLCEFRVVIKVIKKTEALCHPPPEWSLLYLLPLLVYSLFSFSFSLSHLPPTFCFLMLAVCPPDATLWPPAWFPPLSIPPASSWRLEVLSWSLSSSWNLEVRRHLEPHGYSAVVLLPSSAAAHWAPVLMPRTVVWQLVNGGAMCFARDAFLSHSLQRCSHLSFAKSLHTTLFSFFKALITMWN